MWLSNRKWKKVEAQEVKNTREARAEVLVPEVLTPKVWVLEGKLKCEVTTLGQNPRPFPRKES